MTSLAKTSALVMALFLAACGPSPEPELAPVNPVLPTGLDPMTGQPIDTTPGLNDREPDTCHAADYQNLLGQTENEVRASGITRPVRMVTMTTIVDQEMYDSFRINFHTDATGRIVRISCG